MLVKVGVMGGSGNERKGKFFRGVTIYNNNIGDNFKSRSRIQSGKTVVWECLLDR